MSGRRIERRLAAILAADVAGYSRHRGLDLPYTTFDKLRQVSQGAIVENKHLGAALAFIREQQRQTPQQQSQKAPRRQGEVNHLFKVG